MNERLAAIKARFTGDPGLMAAYQAAIARIDGDCRLADHRAALLPDPVTAMVADYQQLVSAPTRELVRLTRTK